jgi:hypothetical protein
MPDFCDEHFQIIVVDIVDDSVVSDAEAPRPASLELPALPGTRVFGEIGYSGTDLCRAVWRYASAQGPIGRASDDNPVGQSICFP